MRSGIPPLPVHMVGRATMGGSRVAAEAQIRQQMEEAAVTAHLGKGYDTAANVSVTALTLAYGSNLFFAVIVTTISMDLFYCRTLVARPNGIPMTIKNSTAPLPFSPPAGFHNATTVDPG